MRKHRPSYNDPPGNIPGGIPVRVCFVSARLTPELLLSRAIGLIREPADKAGLRGIGGVNGLHRHARALGLVADKALQLPKRPVVQPLPLALGGLNPLADVLEVFKRNGPRGAFSLGNDAFRNRVIGNGLKPALFAGELLKPARGGTSADGLQDAPARGVVSAYSLNLRATERCPVAVSRNIDNTQVNAQNTVGRHQGGLINIHHTRGVPLPLNEQQVNLPFAQRQQLALIIATDKGDGLTPVQRPQIDGIALDEPEDAVVIRLPRPLAKRALSLPTILELIGIGNFGDAAHRDLRRQRKLLTQRTIVQLMQRVLPEHLRGKRFPCQPVARLIAPLKGVLQRAALASVRLKLQVDYELHAIKYRAISLACQDHLLTSPALKGGVSRRF